MTQPNKPLTRELEKILCSLDSNPAIKKDAIKKIETLILKDRKAWGEYVIGEDECTCSCNFKDGCLCLSDVKLRAVQRQRNQGEKTDE